MDKHDLERIVDCKSLDDIWRDIDAIVESGVDIDHIISLGEPYQFYFADQYEKILSLGADPLRLFRYNETHYKQRISWVKELAHVLSVYAIYGLGRDFAKKWLLDNIREEDIVPNAFYLEPLGIKPELYIDAYLEHNYSSSILDFDSLPSLVTPNDVVRHFSVRELRCLYEDACGFRYCGFTSFVDEFANANGDVNLLADKFLSELGYPEDEGDLGALALMKYHGATKIDANQIVDALTYEAYIYRDAASIAKVKLWFLDMLIGHLDEAHLEKLKPSQ